MRKHQAATEHACFVQTATDTVHVSTLAITLNANLAHTSHAPIPVLLQLLLSGELLDEEWMAAGMAK